jgi:hypothetical protein
VGIPVYLGSPNGSHNAKLRQDFFAVNVKTLLTALVICATVTVGNQRAEQVNGEKLFAANHR